MPGRLAAPALLPLPLDLVGWRWERQDTTLRLMCTTSQWATPWRDDDEASAVIAIAQRAQRVRDDTDHSSHQESVMTIIDTDLDVAPASTGALSRDLQDIARRYVAARQRSGESLLEAAAALAEARAAAAHGTWLVFLQATGTSEDAAERLLNIHRRASDDRHFADAVTRNWLSPSVAALLARPSTPPEVVTAALESPEPPTARGIAAATRVLKESSPPSQPPAPQLDPSVRPALEAAGWRFVGGGVEMGEMVYAIERAGRRLKKTAAGLRAMVADLPPASTNAAATPRWPELPTPPAPWGWERLASGSCRLINGAQASAWVPQDDADAIASIIAHVADRFRNVAESPADSRDEAAEDVSSARPAIPQLDSMLAAEVEALGGHVDSAEWDGDTPRWSVSTPTGEGGWLSGTHMMGKGRTEAELRALLAERRSEMQRRLRDRHIAPLRRLHIDARHHGWEDVNGRQLPRYILTSIRWWTPQTWTGDQVDTLLAVAGTPPSVADDHIALPPFPIDEREVFLQEVRLVIESSDVPRHCPTVAGLLRAVSHFVLIQEGEA